MSQAQRGTRSPWLFYGWLILAAGFVTQFMGTGLQYTFGVFFKPMLNDFGWDRASLSLAMSINAVIYGAMQPLVGKLVDEYGPRKVIAICSAVMGLGLAGVGLTNDLWMVYVSYGLITAAGYSGLTVVSLSSLVVQWFVKRRGLALSILGAGFAAGQLVLIPFAAYLISIFGWRVSALILGALLAVTVVPLAIFVMKPDPESMGLLPDGERPQGQMAARSEGQRLADKRAGKLSFKMTVGKAARTQDFWLLAAGFFVCGVTANMILTHLAAMTTDWGFSEFAAANALGIVGGAATISAVVIGSLSDYAGRKNPLAAVYFMRGFALLLLITMVSDVAGLYVFAVLFGLSRAATIPLTSGIIGDKYGKQAMGVIYGLILLSHQIGAAVGTYTAGIVYDVTGSYTWAFFGASMLGFAAAIASYFIKEERGRRAPPVPSRI